MENWGEYFNAMVNGIPLLFVVMGLVEYSKRLGLQGRALMVTSLVIGLVLGVGYQVSQVDVLPVTFGPWFAIVVYGLALGLIASQVYDALSKKQ